MGLDEKFEPVIRRLIYPIQFDANPVDGIDRVLTLVVIPDSVNFPPRVYLAAIRAALDSPTQLSSLIPQNHSEAVIREYLAEVGKRLETKP